MIDKINEIWRCKNCRKELQTHQKISHRKYSCAITGKKENYKRLFKIRYYEKV